MHSTSSTTPLARLRKVASVATAVVAVALAPTACDFAVRATAPPSEGAGTGGSGYGLGENAGHGGHGGHTAATHVAVVPVGNVQQDPQQDPEAPGTTAEAGAESTQAAAAQRRLGGQEDGQEDGQERGENRGGGRDEGRGGGRDADATASTSPTATPTRSPSATPTTTTTAPPTGQAPAAAAPLQVLGTDCAGSRRPPHDGFQKAPACVSTSFGEVGPAADNPSLLITGAPERVRTGERFTIEVSTRNLVRDRFLAAGAGGYYRESSFLNGDGVQRGHFHTACRMLDREDRVPESGPVPAFFVATQDNGGGRRPDKVRVEVTGLPGEGVAQCAVWAGDGSHRVPMMERANQIPAFDSVRIRVGR